MQNRLEGDGSHVVRAMTVIFRPLRELRKIVMCCGTFVWSESASRYIWSPVPGDSSAREEKLAVQLLSGLPQLIAARIGYQEWGRYNDSDQEVITSRSVDDKPDEWKERVLSDRDAESWACRFSDEITDVLPSLLTEIILMQNFATNTLYRIKLSVRSISLFRLRCWYRAREWIVV